MFRLQLHLFTRQCLALKESRDEVTLDSCSLKMGPKGFLEMSLTNYHYALRNHPEERSLQTLVSSPSSSENSTYTVNAGSASIPSSPWLADMETHRL
jgi:hypothetical protein